MESCIVASSKAHAFTPDPESSAESSDEEMQATEEDKSDELPVSTKSSELRNDLERVLSTNFNFKGNFAFGSKLSAAPNPGLHITPLGLVGMPLSERDAKSIKEIAAQAPFGHGDRLVVDTNVRHTWEIEPANTITFTNSQWNSFINSTVKTVCTELGVLPSSNPPKCELYKLLLYEEGSHFLPHQDTEKAPGMFATIIIILPSLYSGGQVHVSHGSQKQVFDFSDDGFSTSVLTWYADVTHEVKPITSGYRLALSYYLIQESTSSPLPSVPSTSQEAIMLKHILHRWSKKSYSDSPLPLCVAFVLDHEYSAVDLRLGEKALKGADAHRVGVVRRIAAEEEVAIGLAELEYHVVGSVENEDDLYGGYSNNQSMGEVLERTTKISKLMGLDGKYLIAKDSITVTDEELIPSHPFEEAEPDDQEYKGYMGNESGDVEYWYRVAVLLLYPEVDTHDFRLRAEGNGYAISQLELRNDEEPSPLDRKFANYVIEHLSCYDDEDDWDNAKKSREWVGCIFALALRWLDSDLWLRAAIKFGTERNLDVIGDERLNAAWETFGFDVLRPLLEKAVAQCTSLKAQMKLLATFPPYAKTEDEKNRVLSWCDEQRMSALADLETPSEEDVPVLVDVLILKGMEFFTETIQPQLVCVRPKFKFFVDLVRALKKEQQQLSKHPCSEAHFKEAVQFSLNSAISQWKVKSYTSYNSYDSVQQKGSNSTRIEELCELCFATGEMGVCETLFASLTQDTAQIGAKFENYYMPLVPSLRHLLETHSIPLNAHPFGDFFRYIIEAYLVSMLGAKGKEMHHHGIRKLGCDCTSCAELDRFLFSPNAKKEFRYNSGTNNHLEHQVALAQDIVGYRRITSGWPHGLEVTKHANVVAAATWGGRQKAAKDFLASFGGDAVIELIMGRRYSDVGKAVTGEKAYPHAVMPFNPPAQTMTEPAQSAASPGSDVAAGVKRKSDSCDSS